MALYPKKFYRDIEGKEFSKRIEGFSDMVYDTRADLLAKVYPLLADDGKPTFIQGFASAERESWYWFGGATNTDSSSPAFNTHWFNSNTDSEVLVHLTDPPLSTWRYGSAQHTLVAGVEPTNLPSNTKLVTWNDGYAHHLFEVDWSDPTTPNFHRISQYGLAYRWINQDINTFSELNTWVTANGGWRENTIYASNTTGAAWLNDSDGNRLRISTPIQAFYKWAQFTLDSTADNIFDISLATDPNNLSAPVLALPYLNDFIPATNIKSVDMLQLAGSVKVFDVANNSYLDTESFAVYPIDDQKFGIDVQTDVVAIVTANSVYLTTESLYPHVDALT